MPEQAELIRKQMANTRCSISEKLDLLERRVVNTVEGASNAVNDTVETVKQSVRESVHSLQSGLDPIHQADRHPWTTFTVCLGACYAVGRLLEDRPGPRSAVIDHPAAWPHPSPSKETSSHGGARPGAASTFVRNIVEPLEPDLHKLKQMGIGMLFGVVRDFLHEVAPEPIRTRVNEVVDDVTRRMGGEPVQGPILESLNLGTRDRFESACSREQRPKF